MTRNEAPRWRSARTLRLVMAVARASAGLPALALPPPPDTQAADCRAPSYATDQLVCSRPDLLALDAAVARALAAAPAPTSPLFEPQGAWLRRRSMCAMSAAHAACVMAPYTDRLFVLNGLAAAPATGQTWRCPLPDKADLVTTALPDGGAAISANGSGAVAMASPPAHRAAGWMPFLSFERRSRTATLVALDGRTINCKPARGVPSP